jgi:hypothetical protein
MPLGVQDHNTYIYSYNLAWLVCVLILCNIIMNCITLEPTDVISVTFRLQTVYNFGAQSYIWGHAKKKMEHLCYRYWSSVVR